jgi:hypothetical protein
MESVDTAVSEWLKLPSVMFRVHDFGLCVRWRGALTQRLPERTPRSVGKTVSVLLAATVSLYLTVVPVARCLRLIDAPVDAAGNEDGRRASPDSRGVGGIGGVGAIGDATAGEMVIVSLAVPDVSVPSVAYRLNESDPT